MSKGDPKDRERNLAKTKTVKGPFLTDSILMDSNERTSDGRQRSSSDARCDEHVLNQEWTVHYGSKGFAELWIEKSGRVEVLARIRGYKVVGRGRRVDTESVKAAQVLDQMVREDIEGSRRFMTALWKAMREHRAEPFEALAKSMKILAKEDDRDDHRISRMVASVVVELAKELKAPPIKKAVRELIRKRSAEFREVTDDGINKHIAGSGWGWLDDNRGRRKRKSN